MDFNAGVFDTSGNVQSDAPEVPTSMPEDMLWGEANDDNFRNIGETAVGMGDILPMPEVANNPENQGNISGEQAGEDGDFSAEQIEKTGNTDTVEVQPIVKNNIDKKDEQIKALSLTGEMIDKETEKELKKKIDEYKKSPYELENYRDEAMAKSLKSSFGRIYGKSQGDNSANVIQFSTNQGGRKAA
ncbi:hypothetical protein IKE88_03090 [Candidatus Saccharibacteria bacterium]|nr:hypothetical protein [Candidatus Saccharibacteria bacterium]